jgi:hypothetical protein
MNLQRFLALFRPRPAVDEQQELLFLCPFTYTSKPIILPHMPTGTLNRAYNHYLRVTNNPRDAIGCAIIDVTHHYMAWENNPIPTARSTRRLVPQ